MPEQHKAEKYLLYLDMGDLVDQDQLDQLTRELQDEILEQKVETVDLVSGEEIPKGAKAVEAITWGALAIEVLPTFLPSMVEFLKSWVNREETRNVKVRTQVGDNTVEFEYSSSGVKANEVKELVSILSSSMGERPADLAEITKEKAIDEEKPNEQPEPEEKEEPSLEETKNTTDIKEMMENKPEEKSQEHPADEMSEDASIEKGKRFE